ncbi:hypothetical protein CYQ88_07060 [Hydrogenovibrio sp. SC-1]|uniref:ABC transporter substrate-binding protein n=1 Tax=Hydrogenovibrio sp. SC-1 TaxID=2065820 RepID=UPI000C7BBDBC|nr:ABC transporter substrate-binding protein [Hydrogenovibrio sp. SC-1]PLA74271.1 hypothetical protein CYQ88_07060 [Hydrogenovibrio sp. SC-1]
MAPVLNCTSSRRSLLKAMMAAMMAPTAMVLSSCSHDASPLKVGVSPRIGSEPFYLARDTALIPEGIQLLHFASQTEKNAAIIAGDLDAMTLTLDEVLQLRGVGIPLTVVTVLSVSAGADMLIVKRDKTGKSLLKPGARLGYEPNSIGVLMLMMTLKELGLQKHQLTLVPLAVGEPQKQAWLNDEVDAVITYQPFSSELVRMGCQAYLTSRDLPRNIYDVLAVRTDHIDKKRQQIQQLIDTYYHALEHFVVYQDDSLYRMATRQKVTFAEAQAALQGIVIPGKELNEKWLSSESEFNEAAKQVNRLLFQESVLSRPDELDDFWRNQFL